MFVHTPISDIRLDAVSVAKCRKETNGTAANYASTLGDFAFRTRKAEILIRTDRVSTPEQKCIGWPEQKYISDASRKALETEVFCSGIRLGSDYLPAYPS
jgi:hypothetical protein